MQHKRFDAWLRRKGRAGTSGAGYAARTLSLKCNGPAPGDATDVEMEKPPIWSTGSRSASCVLASLQLVLADVARKDLFDLWQAAVLTAAEPNIACHHIIVALARFRALANARAIPIATIQERFDAAKQEAIGELAVKIS